ncbi:MAG: pilus assembly protein [Candidatus Omnitrophica bacterium]|nr:pilus assembly protein [Candidatus Omnitrophota bacterium]
MSQKGQSLTEFAMSLPLLLLLFLASSDIANIIHIYNRMVDCTWEGARLASEVSQSYGSNNLKKVAVARTQSALTNSGIPWWEIKTTAEVKKVQDGDKSYDLLELASSYQPSGFLSNILNKIGFNFSFPLTLNAKAVGYVNYQ